VSKVVGGYVSGLGFTARTSAATVLGFAINLVANIILIPQFGIVGAAAASLISYTTTAVAITLIASRLAHESLAAFWIPRRTDVRYIWATSRSLLRRIVSRGSTTASPGGEANND
jgi:O-antigen/teichoic acid export membrane protein